MTCREGEDKHERGRIDMRCEIKIKRGKEIKIDWGRKGIRNERIV